MIIKFLILKIFSYIINRNIKNWSINPIKTQKKIFRVLLKSSKGTLFYKEHKLYNVKTYEDFKKLVPIRDYEGYKYYINKILSGNNNNVLFKGRPLYFIKTSGTTSGVKYIPFTKKSLSNQIVTARNILLQYIYETKSYFFLNKKMVFLQGSTNLEKISGIKSGRLSGIVSYHIPKYLKKNRLPSWETNSIKDWEKKIDAIVDETLNQDICLVSGIPPWIKIFFEKLYNKSGKKIGVLFPNFSLMITGGVNYNPYKKVIQEFIGKKINIIQTYPASEGFIAYQDTQKEKGLLLLLNNGIFYEFIPLKDFYFKNPTRINIENVEIGINYVIIINTDSGLWSYNIGDTICFISKNPYRIIVTGRINHFTSAFGEHLIAYEVETSIQKAMKKHNCTIVEFTVAPQVNPIKGLPYHEWYIEFKIPPKNILLFANDIDNNIRNKNIYYNELVSNNILRSLIIRSIEKDGMKKYMKSIGKLGEQYKLPRLSNDRKIADVLNKYILK